MQGVDIEKINRPGPWIFANPSVFPARRGFSNKSDSPATYHAGNKERNEQLKRTPR